MQLTFISLAVLVCVTASAQEPPKTIVIRAARLFDGKSISVCFVEIRGSVLERLVFTRALGGA